MNNAEIVKMVGGKNGWLGFAPMYLNRCSKESNSDEKFDIQVYTKLVELDTRLGITTYEQLLGCLNQTTRLDIIKVRIRI